MRLFFVVLIIVVFVLAGIVFGALNPAMVDYDLGLVRVEIPKGAAILCALVVGWLLGGVVAWLGAGVKRRRGQRAGRAPGKRSADSP